jgi:aryl-alcohol dehydrogenase-like predicted oxidoreductase
MERNQHMQYRKLGSLDWKVSALGFGCMRLPQRRFTLMRADMDESLRIVRHGIDLHEPAISVV